MRIRLASVDEVTTPSEEVAADSDEHLAAQAEYEAQLASDPPQPSTLERIRPDASLELVVGDGSPVVANFDGDRDLLMLGMSWNSWHPERWRVSLSSCSCNEALARRGAKDWFKGHVGPGEDVVVRIGK